MVRQTSLISGQPHTSSSKLKTNRYNFVTGPNIWNSFTGLKFAGKSLSASSWLRYLDSDSCSDTFRSTQLTVI